MINKSFINKISTIQGLQIFQLLRFAGIFLTGIILAKGQVASELIGNYEKIILISGLLSFFWVSGVLNSTLSSFPKLEKRQEENYFFNIAIILFVMGIVMSLVLLSANIFMQGIFSHELKRIIPLLALFIILNNSNYLNEYILLLKEDAQALIRYGILNFLGSVIAVAVPMLLTGELVYALIGLIILAFIKNLYLFKLLNNFSTYKVDVELMKTHLAFALPLIISLLISGSSDYIDGLFISLNFDSAHFAIFRYGAKELPLGLLMANALSSAMIPHLAKDPTDYNAYQRLKKESTKLMHWLFPLSIVLLATSHWLYPLMFRDTFVASAPIFNVYVLLLISRLVFPQTVVMAFRNTQIIFKISIIEISINIISSYVLMKYFGMIGVAWGTVIAFASEKILLAVYLSKEKNIQPSDYIPLKIFMGYSIALVLTYILVENFVLR